MNQSEFKTGVSRSIESQVVFHPLHLLILYLHLLDREAIMASKLKTVKSVQSLTKQLSDLDINSKLDKPNRPAGGTLHKKVLSQSKLTSKYAPTKSKDANGASTSTIVKLAAPGHSRTQSADSKSTLIPTKASAIPKKKFDQSQMDIGKYDGGLELERESLGPPVTGEAAEELAMDSSLLK